MTKKLLSRGPLRHIPVSNIVRSIQGQACISQNSPAHYQQQESIELQPSTISAINIEPIDQSGEILELHPIHQCNTTNLKLNDSISSVESNAVPIINENKVPIDTPSTKIQPVYQIINVQPIHENMEILEEQLFARTEELARNYWNWLDLHQLFEICNE